MTAKGEQGRARSLANLRPQPAPSFEPGNSAALKHGAYALLKLEGEAAELADEIRQLVPWATDADEAAIQTLAMLLRQARRAYEALEAAPRKQRPSLEQNARGWMITASK